MQNTEIAKLLLNKYDSFFEEEGAEEITDEQINELLGTQEELGKILDAMILDKSVTAKRRLKLEKREKAQKRIIGAIMKRMELTEYENEDGKVKQKFTMKFDTDMEKLPEEYKMASWTKIHALLLKGEKIKGVTPTDKFPSFDVR